MTISILEHWKPLSGQRVDGFANPGPREAFVELRFQIDSKIAPCAATIHLKDHEARKLYEMLTPLLAGEIKT